MGVTACPKISLMSFGSDLKILIESSFSLYIPKYKSFLRFFGKEQIIWWKSSTV